MRTALLVICLVASPAAVGQSAIFKCVDAKGNVAYQNKACPNDDEVADIREYEPLSREEAWRAEQDRLRRIANQQASQAAQAQARQRQAQATVVQQPTAVQTKRSQCAAAKAARDQARKNAPMWRDVHYLEPLEERVREACKGLW